MKVKDIIDTDFCNYKKISMFISTSKCNFKCDKECGRPVCQNSDLAAAPNIEIDNKDIIARYLGNSITEAVVIGGMEPFDTFEDTLSFINEFRDYLDDDIVIYTGYNYEEIKHLIDMLKCYDNIIVKFGRFIPDQKKHMDDVLGIKLASDNQYAEKLEDIE